MLTRTCVQIKPGEQVLIIADSATDFTVVRALGAAVLALGAEPTMTVMPPRQKAGEPPTPPVQEAINRADVVLSPATTSMSFTPNLQAGLRERRLRFITMPGVDSDVMTKGAATADYNAIYEVTQRLAKILTAGSQIHLTCPLGTDLTASIQGRRALVAAAFAREPGEIACFPDGESPVAPVEDTAQGVAVIDTSVHMLGLLKEPMRWIIEGGRLVSIEGGTQAIELRDIIKDVENGDNIAEIAIGTNPRARVTGNVSEDKKGAGRVHIGVGNNTGLGGNRPSPIHIDGIIMKPTVTVDGRVIVENGELVVDHLPPLVDVRLEREKVVLEGSFITPERVATVPEGCQLQLPEDAYVAPSAQELAKKRRVQIVYRPLVEARVVCNHDEVPPNA